MERKKVKNIIEGTIPAVLGISLGLFVGQLAESEEIDKEALNAIQNAQPKIERVATVAGETLISEESHLTGMAYGQFDALYNNEYNPSNNVICEEYGDIINLITYDIGYRKGYEALTALKQDGAVINENDIEESIKDVQMFWNSIDKDYIKQLASIKPTYKFNEEGEFIGIEYQETDSSNKQKTR